MRVHRAPERSLLLGGGGRKHLGLIFTFPVTQMKTDAVLLLRSPRNS